MYKQGSWDKLFVNIFYVIVSWLLMIPGDSKVLLKKVQSDNVKYFKSLVL